MAQPEPAATGGPRPRDRKQMTEEWTGGRAFDDPEGYHAWLLTMDADDLEVQRVDRELDAACRRMMAMIPAGVPPPCEDDDDA